MRRLLRHKRGLRSVDHSLITVLCLFESSKTSIESYLPTFAVFRIRLITFSRLTEADVVNPINLINSLLLSRCFASRCFPYHLSGAKSGAVINPAVLPFLGEVVKRSRMFLKTIFGVNDGINVPKSQQRCACD